MFTTKKIQINKFFWSNNNVHISTVNYHFCDFVCPVFFLSVHLDIVQLGFFFTCFISSQQHKVQQQFNWLCLLPKVSIRSMFECLSIPLCMCETWITSFILLVDLLTLLLTMQWAKKKKIISVCRFLHFSTISTIYLFNFVF